MKKIVIFAAIGILFVISILCYESVWRSDWPRYKFRALDAKLPVSDETREYGWGMDGAIILGHGMRSDDGSPSVSRQIEYSFEGDVERVARDLEGEILSEGGKVVENAWYSRWKTAEGVSVSVDEGRFDPRTGITHDDPGWIRVTIHMVRDDGRRGYVNRWIRNTFRP